jgi:hypothetical protein
MALLSGSPALLAGDQTTCLSASINDLDQRGTARSSAARSGCDIGAYDTDAVKQAVNAPAGWSMIGGSPLSLWADATVSWIWDAATGVWRHPTGAEPPGAGAWENLGAASGEQLTVQLCSSGVAVSVPVQPHRWNMVGNPCNKTVQLPPDTRALLWNGATYVLSQTVPAGHAAWVLPTSSLLTLTPT